MMRRRSSKTTWFLAFCLSFVLFAAPALAADYDILVEDETGLLLALENPELNVIGVSGDITLTGPLVLEADLTLMGAGEGASIRVDAATMVDGSLYSQKMIEVSGAQISMNGLILGMEDALPANDAYFWNLISVTSGGTLSLQDCFLDGEGTYFLGPQETSIYDREALNGVYVEDGSLSVEECIFFDFDMSGILLGSGAHDISVASSTFEGNTVGVMTLHSALEDYEDVESTVSSVAIADNSFDGGPFGIALLPNVTDVAIASNDFGTKDEYGMGAGVLVLPVGLADFQGLLSTLAGDTPPEPVSITLEANALLEDVPELEYIHDLLTTHLSLPATEYQVSSLDISGINEFDGNLVGAAFVGCSDDIIVRNNEFMGGACGALVSGFPGTLLGQLLDAILDDIEDAYNPEVRTVSASGETVSSSAFEAAATRHEFPDYEAHVTFEGNGFFDNYVSIGVLLNSDAEISGGNMFVENFLGVLLVNGPGDVSIADNFFGANGVSLATVGYETLLNGLFTALTAGYPDDRTFQSSAADLIFDIPEPYGEIVDELVDGSNSTLLVQNNLFFLPQGQEGIWLLNDRVDANIRFNRFARNSYYEGLYLFGPLAGNTAVRVGLQFDELDELFRADTTAMSDRAPITWNVSPRRASITENEFTAYGERAESWSSEWFDHWSEILPLLEEEDPEPASSSLSASVIAYDTPWSFVLFDIADITEGEYALHLNHFMDLREIFEDPMAYAVAVLGTEEIDGSRNLWTTYGPEYVEFSNQQVREALDWQQAYQYVYGPLTVAPVLNELPIFAPEEFGGLGFEEISGDLYGTSVGDRDVQIETNDVYGLVVNSVSEEEAQKAFTEAELEDLSNLFFLPLDIRIEEGYEGGTLIFRFENVDGLTNDNLVVKTTTPSGVKTWTGENAYVSDDGQWIILTVGPDTDPSFEDFTGSVTMTASSTGGGTSGSGGGCQVGLAPVSALLLLLPLMGLKRK